MVLKSIYCSENVVYGFARALQDYVNEVIDIYGFISVGDVLEFENEFHVMDINEIKYTDFKYGWTTKEIVYIDVRGELVGGATRYIRRYIIELREPEELNF